MKTLRFLLLTLCVATLAIFVSCDENGDFVVFSIENDKDLGNQLASQIAEDPENYPVLSRTEYAAAYAYLDDMFNEILASEEVTYKDEFDWEIFIINQDVLNAFAAPGGKIYVYTGLIYFLDTEDDLAGVIGHEIAHADQRHGSKQLQTQYGISALLSIALGGQAQSTQTIGQVVAGLGTLSFSRSDEAEADDLSVRYLAGIDRYACNGAASFFEKLLENQETRQPEFLSTHPDPENRVEDINAEAIEIGCSTARDDESVSRYRAFWQDLP
ncbi:MAG: M48 family metalloprotease [Bacteroidota bacterium]